MTVWTEERRALRGSAKAFTRKEVLPHLQKWEDAGEVPRSLQRAAARLGFLGVGIPEAQGGSGGDFLDALVMTEAMVEEGASSGLLAALFTSGIALPHIVADGNPELVDRFVRPTVVGETIGALAVTEPGGGSDVANITTSAVLHDDHYVVNGAKTFITSGVRADFVTSYAIAARALALTAEYARKRDTFGGPLASRQVIQHTPVEMHRRVDVARSYTREVAARHVAGEPVIAEALMAKATAVEACGFVVDRAVQIHGGSGYLHGTEVERHYRDARILGIGGGATEVLNDLTARLLGYAS